MGLVTKVLSWSPLSLIDKKLGKAVSAIGITAIGVITGNPYLISTGVSMGASLLIGKQKTPGNLAGMQDRLNVSIDLRAPRTMAIGHTAQRADIGFLPL